MVTKNADTAQQRALHCGPMTFRTHVEQLAPNSPDSGASSPHQMVICKPHDDRVQELTVIVVLWWIAPAGTCRYVCM